MVHDKVNVKAKINTGVHKLISYTHQSDALSFTLNNSEWDSEILTAPVGDINNIKITDYYLAQQGFNKFKQWILYNNYKMISCRLDHDKLRESHFLEKNGFRFVEMVLHPTMSDIQNCTVIHHGLKVTKVEAHEIPAISKIASRAFGCERFHVDPFLGPELGNESYKNWIENSHLYKNQVLLKVCDNVDIIAFFLIEQHNETVYWHLTAVNPLWQGKGFGFKAWMAMIEHHQMSEVKTILTTISARNTTVLNLYSKLNFKFNPPEMTFHWTHNDNYSF